jgi:5'-3' exonuclease
MQIHLLDATYELFRAHFGRPPHDGAGGMPVGATLGVVESVLFLLRREGVTHLGCATDHVIRSWRNDRYPGYKTEAGMPPELLAQFPLVEDALRAVGVVVWPMVEFEADDALGAAAARFAEHAAVERVVILSPDKDMAQCVREDGRVLTFDRRAGKFFDADAVEAKFGVRPASIPDYLALVGDSADGYPGLPGWGARSAATVLQRYPHLEDIPDSVSAWDLSLRGGATLARTLKEQRREALLFRELAILRIDAPIPQSDPDELRWRGVDRAAFEALAVQLRAPRLLERLSSGDGTTP